MVIHAALHGLQQALVVSVQAERHEPLGDPAVLTALAQSALMGGAKGLRLADPAVLAAMRALHPTLPIIGLAKPEPIPADFRSRVYITATLTDARPIVEAGASILALDATDRPRPDGNTLAQLVVALREHYPELALMADCATLQDVTRAMDLGFDGVSTTLAGYTTDTATRYHADEPDWDLLEQALAKAAPTQTPVIAEGRFWTPEQAARAWAMGAFAVVVGSAITRPQLVTHRFVAALETTHGETAKRA